MFISLQALRDKEFLAFEETMRRARWGEKNLHIFELLLFLLF